MGVGVVPCVVKEIGQGKGIIGVCMMGTGLKLETLCSEGAGASVLYGDPREQTDIQIDRNENITFTQ